MRTDTWIRKYTSRLDGKTVAITGATGGLGRETCRYLASLGASLILLDRNAERSARLSDSLLAEFPSVSIERIQTDLEDIGSVERATEELKGKEVDVLICNAGAYSIPRRKTDSGYDNVFQINFASPYYMIRALLPSLRERKGRVVIVGSIAHRYSVSDPSDVDFSTRSSSALVYGNSKRYLMFTLAELLKDEKDVSFACTHPGITFTNITAHYPKFIFAIIKHPMKIIFPKPRRACLSVLRGVFEDCGYCEWIGPRIFGIWGTPKKSRLHSCSPDELRYFAEWNEKYKLPKG